MNQKNDVQRQLDELNEMPFSDLKELFAELFGFDCGQTNIHNVRKRLAYKIQENIYGGLSADDLAKIAELAKSDPLANMKTDPAKPRKVARGTRIHRDWKGRTYEVIVLEDGQYEFEGIKYRSLSAIADKITGTHCNGKKFFGVK